VCHARRRQRWLSSVSLASETRTRMADSLAQFTVDFDAATEFLDYIRPSRDHWRVGVKGKLRWIFRGQRDHTWGLTPSAWRKDEKTRREIELLSMIGEDRLVDFDCLLDRCRL